MANAHLRAHYVWVPMLLPTDNEAAARASAQRFDEPRATHYWDGDRRLSRRLATALAIDTRRSLRDDDKPAYAWDVYLAYRRGNPDIAEPDSCMHQLAADHAPRFEPAEWRRANSGNGGRRRCVVGASRPRRQNQFTPSNAIAPSKCRYPPWAARPYVSRSRARIRLFAVDSLTTAPEPAPPASTPPKPARRYPLAETPPASGCRCSPPRCLRAGRTHPHRSHPPPA